MCVELAELALRLAEAEVTAPTPQIAGQGIDYRRQTDTPSSPRQLLNAQLGASERLGSNLPFATVVRDAETQKRTLLRLSNGALRFIDRQPELHCKETAHASHDSPWRASRMALEVRGRDCAFRAIWQ